MKHAGKIFVIAVILSTAFAVHAVQQTAITRIEQMPNMPAVYQMRDWKAVARQYDSFVFDFTKTGPYLPLIWWDTTNINFNRTGFGMPSYVGRFGQNGANGHESINCMAAVIGATLSGVDKSSQNGYNWVLMQENYFNSANGQNLYLNNEGGTTGGTFWYETLPSVFFYQLNYLYPNTGNFSSEFITTADRWYDALVAMGAKTSPWTLPNLNWTAFRFSDMTPVYNGTWRENDAGAAIGWVEYMAYIKTGNTKYLTGARWCMEYLLAQTSSPLYDVVMAFSPYLGARMNAEQGTSYDVTKLLNWCFMGNNLSINAATWGPYGIDGLMGSNTYVFEMESITYAGAIVPLVRYDQRYARAIGKYMLNSANSMRLFYPNAHDANHQTCYNWASMYDPCSCIGYEGLKKERVDYNHAAADYSTSPGTIMTGSYQNTWARDNGCEVLQESYTGRPYSDHLQHIWYVPLTSGYFHQIVVKGHIVKIGGDNDTGFDFYWSTSPTGPWTGPIFTISTTSTTDEFKWTTVSPSSNSFYVKVQDNYQTSALGDLDQLSIDEMYVETRNNTVVPYASGDPLSFYWGNTDLGLYGSAHVGVLGGIVSTTNVNKILQLDLLKTDYYRSQAYPTYLYYNPYSYARAVDVNVGLVPVDVYDTVFQEMKAVNVLGHVSISMPPDTAQVLVLAPANGKVTVSGGKKYLNGVVVDYQSNTTFSTCSQVVASPQRLTGDLNGDCTVDMEDINVLTQSWLTTGSLTGACDVDDDNSVDFMDYAQLAENWGATIVPGYQLESFDNFAANGWTDGYSTGLAVEALPPDNVYEGTGSMRVKFENRTTQWEVAPTKNFSPTLDLSGKSLTFRIWTDLVGSSRLNQVIIWDTLGHLARYTVTKPTSTGWSQITAPISAFVPDGSWPNLSNIATMQLWFSTYSTPGNSVYIDDMRVVVP